MKFEKFTYEDVKQAAARNVGNYKRERKKQNCKTVLRFIVAAILVNTALTSIIYRVKNPHKTETEAFLHIPKSFIYNFK